jgi:Tfp pilus assembly protein PilF
MRWNAKQYFLAAVLAMLVLANDAMAGSGQAVPGKMPAQPAASSPAAELTPIESGDALMVQKRYQAAIEAYKKAPQDSAEVLNRLGIAYQMMFSLENATRSYMAALRLSPKDPHVLNNLGTVYDSEKQFGDAERAYRKAIRLDPSSAVTYKNLGTALLAQRKYKRGWEAYQHALALDPQIFQDKGTPHVQNPGSIENRGAMNYYMARGCVRAGMNDCAIDYLRMALNEGFTNPKKIAEDREFAALKGVPAFEQLLAGQGRQ